MNDQGTLPTAPSWTYDAPNVGNAIAVGDINGDGCADLAIGFSGEPSIRIFYASCAPPVDPCPADIMPLPDGDGVVNVSDLLAVIGAWGNCSDPENCPADVNGDDTVNVSDLLGVIGAWGNCP